MSRAGFLFAQCLLESLLSVSDKLLITIRVDKNTGTILRIALQFGEHVEVPAMGSQKYVAGQSTQHRKGMLEILNDAGVAYGWPGVATKWYSDQKPVPPTMTIFRIVSAGSPGR